MDNHDDRDNFGDPTEGYDTVSHQLAAILTRLERIEVAVTLSNARRRQRAPSVQLRIVSTFGLGFFVGALVVVLMRLPFPS